MLVSFNLFSTLPVSLATPTCIHLHCISKNVVERKAKSLSQDLEVKWGSYNDLLQVLLEVCSHSREQCGTSFCKWEYF